MNVLPGSRVSASDWAHQAWSQAKGQALTVPADALQALIDGYVTAMAALKENVREVITERAESVTTVDTVGVSS